MKSDEARAKLQRIAGDYVDLIKHFRDEAARLLEEDGGDIERAFPLGLAAEALKSGDPVGALRYLEPIDDEIKRNVDEALKRAGVLLR